MGVKSDIIRGKVKNTVYKVLDTTVGKPLTYVLRIVDDYRLKRVNRKVSVTTEEQAVKVMVNVITRDVVKYRPEEKFIVVADWVDTEYGLSAFQHGGDIGIFKNRWETEVYKRYVEEDKNLQLKVLDELKIVKGLDVEDIPEDELPQYDFNGYLKAVKVKVGNNAKT